MTWTRRDLLKLSPAALLAAYATPPLATRPQAADARARAWNRALLASPGRMDLVAHVSSVEGKVPDALFGGRYLVNGPSALKLGGRLAHPFDGHGYVRAFTFLEDGSVDLRARPVDTEAWRAESRADALVYRGLGTLPYPADWRHAGRNRAAPMRKNVANTTIVPFAGRLFAGWEGGLPHELDPDSLATKGPVDFGVLGPDDAFLAHVKHDKSRGVMVGASPTMGPKTTIVFRELNESLQELSSTTVSFDGGLFLHDFVITERYYGFALNPLSIDFVAMGKVLLGTATMIEMIGPNDDKARAFVLVPRPRRGERGARTATPLVISLPIPVFAIHYANAYDDGDEVVVDTCAFPTFRFGQELGYQGPDAPLDPSLSDKRAPPRLFRLVVDPKARTASAAQISAHGVEFPRVHPDHDGRQTRLLVAGARRDERYGDPFDSLLVLDLDDLERPEQLWTVPEGSFVGEPVLWPGADGKDYVVVCVYDGDGGRTQLCVLDAADVPSGPLARATFPLLPYGFHTAPLPA